MLSKVIKNTTNTDIFIEEAGVTILANDQIILDPLVHYLWAKPEMAAEITTAVNAGSIVINNGLADLSPSDGLRYLENPDRISITLNTNSVKKVVTDIDVQGDASVTDQGDGKVRFTVGQNNTPIGKLYTIEAFAVGVTTNKWLLVEHPNSPSNQAPFVMPGGGLGVALTYSNANNSSECDIEIYKNGSLVYTWQIRNKRLAWKTVAAGMFTTVQGDRLSIFLRKVTGTDAKDPLIMVSMMMTSFPDADSGIENGV
jgi:hypothetical protein